MSTETHFNSGSNLEKVLKSGQFAFTGELGPPRGTDVEEVREKAKFLKGNVDSVNITDNQTAVVRMSSWAASLIAIQEGLEPNYQMVCRDRNRLAMQADILGGYALGIRNMLCLSGDHQKFGDHPDAKGVFDIDSMQLIAMVKQMRDEGKFLSGTEIHQPPKMFIGAAAIPLPTPLSGASIAWPRRSKPAPTSSRPNASTTWRNSANSFALPMKKASPKKSISWPGSRR